MPAPQRRTMSETIQAIRGMSDVLPDEAPLWEFFEDTVRDWLRDYGYRNIRMPIVERTELFVRSIGEVTDIVEKEMYTFVDQLNGESLTLRPEGTASCVRAVLQHNLLYGGPQRLYYIGPDVPARAPAERALSAVPSGRRGSARAAGSRCGRRAHGDGGAPVEAAWVSTDIRLQINTLGSAEVARTLPRAAGAVSGAALRRAGRRRQAARAHQPAARARQQEPGDAGVDRGGPAASTTTWTRTRSSTSRTCRRSCARWSSSTRSTRAWCAASTITITPCTNGPTERLGAQAAVCAGGRYDGLIAQLGGKPRPACGYAMGIERLLALIADDAGSRSCRAPTRTCMLACSGQRGGASAWQAAEALARCRAERSCCTAAGAASSRRCARRTRAGRAFAVIVGEGGGGRRPGLGEAAATSWRSR